LQASYNPESHRPVARFVIYLIDAEPFSSQLNLPPGTRSISFIRDMHIKQRTARLGQSPPVSASVINRDADSQLMARTLRKVALNITPDRGALFRGLADERKRKIVGTRDNFKLRPSYSTVWWRTDMFVRYIRQTVTNDGPSRIAPHLPAVPGHREIFPHRAVLCSSHKPACILFNRLSKSRDALSDPRFKRPRNPGRFANPPGKRTGRTVARAPRRSLWWR
jgi:hypothetical protein